MLFNSFEFIFLYLPITFAFFFIIGRHSIAHASLWMFAASLFFYGWWNPAYVSLLLGSILFNFGAGSAISLQQHKQETKKSKNILIIAILSNLALLAYYKYYNFFIKNINLFFATALPTEDIVLPLGISFFTFTQIAFLVDAYQKKVTDRNFIRYGLFVTYFPHLIAGPVLHHKEMMPQFANTKTYKPTWENISVGFTIFIIGLFKKLLLADNVAPFADKIFASASNGELLSLTEAWLGVLSYALQLYFDFSAYSDMAIGISRLFGIKLPLNFNSPYKALNIIDFWRRWHMTLSRFLRDYLYFPLGGNRNGPIRRYFNLLMTMLIGGMWHGAGWNFIIWGGLHGLYLCVNHAWNHLRVNKFNILSISRAEKFLAWLLTFIAVLIGWVFFRANDFPTALSFLKAMTAFNSVIIPTNWPGAWYIHSALSKIGISNELGLPVSQFDPEGYSLLWVVGLLFIACLMPNTQEIMVKFAPALDELTITSNNIVWKPRLGWAIIIGFLSAFSILSLNHVSEFLYFQF